MIERDYCDDLQLGNTCWFSGMSCAFWSLTPPPLSSRLEPDGGDLTAMFGRTGVWDASRCIMYQYWGVSWERSYTLEAAEAL